MNVTCAVCGQVNAEGTQFCVNPSCGAYLPWDQTAGHRRPPQRSDPPGGRTDPPPPPQSQAQPQTSRHPQVGHEQRIGVHIELAQSSLAVEPGQVTETQATIHNTGNRVERLLVRVSGPAAPWAIVEPAEITVYPGQPGTCTVRFAPPRHATSSAGMWNFGVLADSQVTPGLQASAMGSVRLGGFRALSVKLEPGTMRGGGRTEHTLVIDNQGNAPEQVRLGASDTEGLLRFDLMPGATANPGRSSVTFKVRAQRDWFGRPKRVPFRVVARPADGQQVSADGVRVVRPRLGVLSLVLAGVLLAVVAGGIALNLRSSPNTSEASGGDAIVTDTPSESPTKKEPKPKKSPTPKVINPPPKENITTISPPPPKENITTITPPPPNPATKLLVEYRREGGLAGFVDRITVFGDGHATVTRVTTNVDTNLTPDELKNLNENLQHLEFGQSDPEPTGGDHVKYELIVDGNRSVRYDFYPPNWESVITILNQVIER